jgi:hypothetical protein
MGQDLLSTPLLLPSLLTFFPPFVFETGDRVIEVNSEQSCRSSVLIPWQQNGILQSSRQSIRRALHSKLFVAVNYHDSELRSSSVLSLSKSQIQAHSVHFVQFGTSRHITSVTLMSAVDWLIKYCRKCQHYLCETLPSKRGLCTGHVLQSPTIMSGLCHWCLQTLETRHVFFRLGTQEYYLLDS